LNQAGPPGDQQVESFVGTWVGSIVCDRRQTAVPENLGAERCPRWQQVLER